jgi:hypothetical protein
MRPQTKIHTESNRTTDSSACEPGGADWAPSQFARVFLVEHTFICVATRKYVCWSLPNGLRTWWGSLGPWSGLTPVTTGKLRPHGGVTESLPKPSPLSQDGSPTHRQKDGGAGWPARLVNPDAMMDLLEAMKIGVSRIAVTTFPARPPNAWRRCS